MLNIKEIAPKLTQKLSIAINDDEAVEFAEALIAEIAKQNEPKKVKFFGWLGTSGELRQIRANESWPNQHGLIRIPELDREITLPEGE